MKRNTQNTGLRLIGLLGLLFLSAGGFFSCSVKQELSLELSGRGRGRLEVTLEPILVEYLTDLSMVVSEHPDPDSRPIFDEAAIWQAFDKSPEIQLLSVEIPRRERLIVEFGFRDINKAFRDLTDGASPGGNPLTFTRTGRQASWAFRLTAESFYRIMEFFPLMDESLLDYFGPNPQDPIPEDLYKEDLEMAFEEYLEGKPIDPILERSVVSIFVRTEGEITGITGGRKVNGGALFETPVIRFLTLVEPVEYRLEFTVP